MLTSTEKHHVRCIGDEIDRLQRAADKRKAIEARKAELAEQSRAERERFNAVKAAQKAEADALRAAEQEQERIWRSVARRLGYGSAAGLRGLQAAKRSAAINTQEDQ